MLFDLLLWTIRSTVTLLRPQLLVAKQLIPPVVDPPVKGIRVRPNGGKIHISTDGTDATTTDTEVDAGVLYEVEKTAAELAGGEVSIITDSITLVSVTVDYLSENADEGGGGENGGGPGQGNEGSSIYRTCIAKKNCAGRWYFMKGDRISLTVTDYNELNADESVTPDKNVTWE